MIQANELRIGNWIRHNGMAFQCYRETFFDMDYSVFDPIPLTPEILEKAGFRKDRTGYVLPDNMSLSFSITKDGEYMACWQDKAIQVIVTSVHQLQNIYFALTGTELSITL